jgi:cell filamentation protein
MAVQLAGQHALNLGQDKNYLREHPGEVFDYLTHAHPFLEGNGRTILTIYSELSRRAGFHVEWEAIDKTQFLEKLTLELLNPGKSIMDELVIPYVRPGGLSVDLSASRLRVNFKREQATSSSDSKTGDEGLKP